jgi:hypothetical protein
MKFILKSDAPTIHTRSMMGLKKRSLSLVGRGKPCTERYRDQELVACGWERHTKKGLGFFGHVTGQASGLRLTSRTPKITQQLDAKYSSPAY